MIYKKILAVALGAVLLGTLLVGCNETVDSPFVSSSPNASTDASTPTVSASTLNLAGAYSALDPETAMLVIDGDVFTWEELFYYVNYNISTLENQGVQITDWSAIISDDQTFNDYILDTAVNYALQDAAVLYGAEQLELTLSEQNLAEIQAEWDMQIQSAGSEEALKEMLEADYGTIEIYEHLAEVSYFAQLCFDAMYGEAGETLSDEEVADFTAEDGYLMAKHILLTTLETDEDGNSTPMSDDDKASIYEKMQGLLTQLQEYEGDDFDAFFDELMMANSEDPGGVSSFPQGYLFQNADMVPAFSDTTEALKIGEVSDIIEVNSTGYSGYHIIYRIPLNFDIVPMSYSNYGDYSLRYIVSIDMFRAVLDTWLNSLDITYSDEYEALDFNSMFAAG